MISQIKLNFNGSLFFQTLDSQHEHKRSITVFL